MIESISTVTLATHDMKRACKFYHALGFEVLHGARSRRSPAFATAAAHSISWPNLRSATGRGGVA
jgi:catechol 2,3-dioxygenase-like lactoylglutathione lyase family enzyme